MSATKNDVAALMPIASFQPLVGEHVNRLILGSIPGKASLNADRYYAHPRNSFWPIMSELLNINDWTDYSRCCQALQTNRIALWDVMKTCERASSLDADIVESTIIVNDFPGFLAIHSSVHTVFFNGAKAYASFQKYAIPALGERVRSLSLLKLPSTSPAHAAMSYVDKREHWRAVIQSNSKTIKKEQ